MGGAVMRGLRFAPFVIVTMAVVVAVGAAVAGQGLVGSPDRAAYPLGGTVTIVLVAAVATLPLVVLLAFLRRHPLSRSRLAFSSDRVRCALGLGVLLIFPSMPFVFGGFQRSDTVRTTTIVMVGLVLGVFGAALGLARLIRWLDTRFPFDTGTSTRT
jgi:hypothetical protein